jgi:hypothetical protein
MTKNAKQNETAEAPGNDPGGADRPCRSKLFLPLGRGSRGKTLLSRYVIEQALLAGRAPVVADADRTNPTLGKYFQDVASPPSAEDADVVAFLEALIERQADQHFDLVLDLGGGDLVLKRAAHDMDFQHWLPELGIDAVAVHLLGPSADDLSYLQSLEEGRLLAPPATILVLNEAAVLPDVTAHAAFAAAVSAHPIVTATVERGARIVSMPRLQTAPAIEAAQMLFHQGAANKAPAGQKPLGVWKAQQTTVWLRQMKENFSPVAHWLP